MALSQLETTTMCFSATAIIQFTNNSEPDTHSIVRTIHVNAYPTLNLTKVLKKQLNDEFHKIASNMHLSNARVQSLNCTGNGLQVSKLFSVINTQDSTFFDTEHILFIDLSRETQPENVGAPVPRSLPSSHFGSSSSIKKMDNSHEEKLLVVPKKKQPVSDAYSEDENFDGYSDEAGDEFTNSYGHASMMKKTKKPSFAYPAEAQAVVVASYDDHSDEEYEPEVEDYRPGKGQFKKGNQKEKQFNRRNDQRQNRRNQNDGFPRDNQRSRHGDNRGSRQDDGSNRRNDRDDQRSRRSDRRYDQRGPRQDDRNDRRNDRDDQRSRRDNHRNHRDDNRSHRDNYHDDRKGGQQQYPRNYGKGSGQKGRSHSGPPQYND